MHVQKKNLSRLNIDKSWSLFLDRDGVINKHLQEYVRNWELFEFLPTFLTAIEPLSDIFGRIIIVTNQRGIGKGLYTEEDLCEIHSNMLKEIHKRGGRIDGIYYCPHLDEDCPCRKPNTGMAKKAINDFNEIDPAKSFMIGDAESDMEFGKRMGMITVLLPKKTTEENIDSDLVFENIYDFYKKISGGNNEK